MNNGEPLPPRFAVPQPIEQTLACAGAGSMSIETSRFIYHEQMLVLENQARQVRTACSHCVGAAHQKCHASPPLHTIQTPSRKFVIPCAVMASPRRFLRITSP